MIDKTYRIKLLIVTILAVVICYSIEYEIVGWQINKPRIEEGSVNQLNQLSFLEAGQKTEGSLCVIGPDADSVDLQTYFNEYIELSSWRTYTYLSDHFERYRNKERKVVEKYEEYALCFYNYRTGQMEKSVDLVAVAEECTPEKQYNGKGISEGTINGKRYLQWQVESIEEPDYSYLRETIIYDFDEDKVVDDETAEATYDAGIWHSIPTEEMNEWHSSVEILWDSDSDFKKIHHLTGIDFFYTKAGAVKVTMPVTRLPENNTRLYEEFPELKEYSPEEGDIAGLWFAGYPDIEEVVGMLLEEGEEAGE